MNKSPISNKYLNFVWFSHVFVMVSILGHKGTEEILLNSLNVFTVQCNLWKYFPH